MTGKPTYEELEQRVRELEQAESNARHDLKAFQEKEEKFRAAFEGSHDAITLTTKEGTVLDCNHRTLELFGLQSKNDFSEKRPADFSPPLQHNGRPSVETSRELINKVFREGKAHQFEWLHQRKTGEVFPAEVILTPVRVGNQEVLQASIRDITERRRTEQALRESERKWKNILVDTPQIGIALDTQANLVFANKRFLELTGWRKDEIIGRNWFDLFIPEDVRETVRKVFDAVVHAKSTQDLSSFENEIVLKSGERRTIAWSNVLSKDANGEIVDVTCLGVDLTERKQAEQALEAQRAQLKSLFDYSGEAIVLLDIENHILDANSGFERIFGYSLEEAREKLIEDLICPERFRDTEAKELDEEALNGIKDVEIIRKRKDGEEIDVRVSAGPIKVGDNLTGRFVVFEDITERKQAEEALRESEAWLGETTRIARVGGWKIDLLSNTLEWTDETFRIHELPIGNPPNVSEAILFYHAEDRPRVSAAVQHALEHGESYDFEARIITAKQNLIWVRSIGHASFHEGRMVLVWGIIQDITDRKWAEQALQDSEALLEATGLMARVGGWQLDAETMAVTWTKETYRIHEVPQDFKPPLDKAIEFFHPDDRGALSQAIQRALDRGEPYDMELRFITAKGNKLWTRTICRPEVVDGKTVRLRGTFQDITERKLAEEALRKSEKRYHSLFESIRDAILVTDSDRKIIDCNSAFSELFGYSLEELEGKKTVYVYESENEYVQLGEALKGHMGEPGFFCTVHYKKKSGEIFPGETNVFYLRSEEGEVIGFIGMIRDVTEHRRMQAEKAKLEKQYRQAQKVESIGRLAGGVAHDLNNLLSPILGYSEMLRDDLDPEDNRRESLDEIMSAGLRARDLVRQLLAFSRKQILEFKPMDLNKVVAGLKSLLQRTIREDIEMAFDLSPDPEVTMADIGQIEQVIMNLAVNAADAMPEGGQLSIETSHVDLDEEYAKSHQSVKPGRHVMLAISDTGHGMDEETQEHIFEPFFSTKGDKGTGLGLSTVYGIVKQHGGNIWVYSEPGRGTTFKIYLPVADKSEAEEKARPEETPDLKGSETILLVEDNDQVRRLARSVLSRNGYRVLDAKDGRDALERLGKYDGPVHLLLSDVVLPGMNGKELYEEALAMRPSLKVLYMSGYTGNVIAHRGVLDEGVQFIQKPFTVQGLAIKARELLDEK